MLCVMRVLGAVHKGRLQRRGRLWSNADGERGGKGPCGRPQAGTFLHCFCMLCRHSLWMMPIEVQIVIHLIRFAPQSIIWPGTDQHTSYSQGEVVNYMTH